MMVEMFFMHNWRVVMVVIMVIMVLNNMVSWVVGVRIPVFASIVMMLSCMWVEEIMCLMMWIWVNCLMMDGWSGVMWSLMVDWCSFVMNWCWMSIDVSWCVDWCMVHWCIVMDWCGMMHWSGMMDWSIMVHWSGMSIAKVSVDSIGVLVVSTMM